MSMLYILGNHLYQVNCLLLRNKSHCIPFLFYKCGGVCFPRIRVDQIVPTKKNKMALSVVHFRMIHGNQSEQITFSGTNGIKLIDLKKEIVDKKKISSGLDFDLTISDENGKGSQFIIQTCSFLVDNFF
jgi:hypothetical protein